MKSKSVHEPTAEVMSAAEVWEDAQQLADVLRQNLWKTEPLVKSPIPLSVFLSLLDTFGREELIKLRQHVEARLSVLSTSGSGLT